MDYESVFQCLVLLAVMMDDHLLKQSITLQNCDYILVSGSLLIEKKCQKGKLQLLLQLLSIMHSFFLSVHQETGEKVNFFFFCKSPKNILVHMIHWSIQLKRTLLALKHQLLLFLFTQIMITRAYYWLMKTYFRMVPCTMLCYDLKSPYLWLFWCSKHAL